MLAEVGQYDNGLQSPVGAQRGC